MIQILRDPNSKLIYIGDSEFGSSEDFQLIVSGDSLEIIRPLTGSKALVRTDFGFILDDQGNGFNTVIEAQTYIQGLLTPVNLLGAGDDLSLLNNDVDFVTATEVGDENLNFVLLFENQLSI